MPMIIIAFQTNIVTKFRLYDIFQINAKVKQVFDKYRQNGVRCKFFVEKLGERGDN